MKKSIIFYLLISLIYGCNWKPNNKTAEIEIRILAVFPLDSSELFSDPLYQLFKPIKTQNEIDLNAFNSKYEINIQRIGIYNDTNITITGKKAWWDLQLLGKPKAEKLGELAISNFSDVRYCNTLNIKSSKNDCELKYLQEKRIYEMDSMGYSILIYDSLCASSDFLLGKYKIYRNYNSLKEALANSYTETNKKFLIVHRLACCQSNEPIEPEETLIPEELENEKSKISSLDRIPSEIEICNSTLKLKITNSGNSITFSDKTCADDKYTISICDIDPPYNGKIIYNEITKRNNLSFPINSNEPISKNRRYRIKVILNNKKGTQSQEQTFSLESLSKINSTCKFN